MRVVVQPRWCIRGVYSTAHLARSAPVRDARSTVDGAASRAPSRDEIHQRGRHGAETSGVEGTRHLGDRLRGWEAGGAGWGAGLPDEQVLDAIRAGFDVGINWLDTAEIYGDGRSEELIGRVIEDSTFSRAGSQYSESSPP